MNCKQQTKTQDLWDLGQTYRALDEDTVRLISSSSLLLHWARQVFLGIPSLISDPVRFFVIPTYVRMNG